MTNHQEKKKIYIYDLVALKGTGKTQIKHTGYSNTEDYRDGEILVNGGRIYCDIYYELPKYRQHTIKSEYFSLLG